MPIRIEAFQIAELLNIKKFRDDFHEIEHFGTQSEIFYEFPESNQYLYVFDYGVIVFANYDAESKKTLFAFAQKYTTTSIANPLNEEYQIEINPQLNNCIVKNNFVTVPKLTPSIMRIVTLNTGQSVALEYYEMLTDQMIISSKHYIEELEYKGKLSISKTNLLKYIGEVLNIKNSIIDNLYILDDPNLVWDNEELNFLNRQLKANFEINTRFKDIDYRLQIIKDNLTLFTDVLNVRESSRLEWVIIALIGIEIAIALLFH
jgi:required for meiotic nuclear division protein 1